MDKTYTILEATKASESYKPPVQSADTLFHFVKKLDYLLPAIEREALVPRYCVENIEYLGNTKRNPTNTVHKPIVSLES